MFDFLTGMYKEFTGIIFKFFTGLVSGIFKNAITWLTGVVMVPLAYYVFGPMMKLTGTMMKLVMDKVASYGNPQAVELTGLSAWLLGCFRFQECMVVLVTFLTFGLMLSFLKSLFK